MDNLNSIMRILDQYERITESMSWPSRLLDQQANMIESLTAPTREIAQQMKIMEDLIEPIARLQEEQARIIGALTGPRILAEQYAIMIETTIGPAIRLQEEQARIIEALTGPRILAEQLNAEMIKSLIEPVRSIGLSIKANFFAQRKLFNIGPNVIGQMANFKEADSKLLKSQLDNFLFSYKGYFDSIKKEEKLTEKYSSNLKLASVEVFNAALQAEITTIKKEQEEDEKEFIAEIELTPKTIKSLLKSVDSDFAVTYEEAIEAFKPGRTYRGRQLSTALRTIFDELLRMLAPDKECSQWIKDQKIKNKKLSPTKADRFRYICRTINDEKFKEFIEHDAEVAIGFLKVINKGVHSLKSYEEDIILKTLLHRMNYLFYYLINLSKESQ